MKFQKWNSTRTLAKLLLSSIIFTFVFAPACLAMPEPTEQFYVNDAANILSEETENYIFENSRKLDEGSKAQIVVVTVPNLEGRDIESYATELFRNYGIGDKEKNSGLLLLIALEERKLRIEVGYGLEGAIPDGKAGRIRDNYIVPYLKDNKWDEGITNGYKALYNEVAREYNYDGSVEPAKEPEEDYRAFWITIFIISVFTIIIVIIYKSSIKEGVIGSSSSGGRFGGSLSSGSSGGSSGGGYSGGGGSSGGGGASGSF